MFYIWPDFKWMNCKFFWSIIVKIYCIKNNIIRLHFRPSKGHFPISRSGIDVSRTGKFSFGTRKIGNRETRACNPYPLCLCFAGASEARIRFLVPKTQIMLTTNRNMRILPSFASDSVFSAFYSRFTRWLDYSATNFWAPKSSENQRSYSSWRIAFQRDQCLDSKKNTKQRTITFC